MDHRPFPKIPSRVDAPGTARGGVWVALEKIHGAHLVVGCDGCTTRVGKRKRWLSDGEPFFGWQFLRSDLDVAARSVYAVLGSPMVVRLYGELFGGAYPHPEVRPTPGLSAVQTGVWYSPNLHFALFDVLVEGAPGDVGEFLSHSELDALSRANGLLTVPVAGRGPRTVVDALPLRVPTQVPALFDLPALEGNLAEGLVLKPDVRAAPNERSVLKRKNAEFDEGRFDQAVPFRANVVLGVDELAALTAPLINSARVAAARSKVGPSTVEIRSEVALDVLVDLEAAFPAAFAGLSASDEDRLRAAIDTLVTALVYSDE